MDSYSRKFAPQAQPGLQFLGDGYSHQHALSSAGQTLNQALAPTFSPSPETFCPNKDLGVDELSAAFNAVEIDTPLGSLDEALKELNDLWVSHAIRYDSPRYLAHLNCPTTAAGFAGATISAGLNTAVESWDQGRGAAIIEDQIIKWFAASAGMSTNNATGTFTSGGTQSNLQALYTSREKALNSGSSLDSLRVLCSEEAHYSIARSAHILGLPKEAVITIDCDSDGALKISSLRRTINSLIETDGKHTIACLALTAGTTDLGAIDPIAQATQIAQQHGIYVHVDCAYGGALLLSDKNQKLLSGLHQANSFSLDFHKTFFQPVACSALIYRDLTELEHVTWHSDYLNPETDTRLNLANRSLQTTRRFDALKLWLSLRADGPKALGQAFDRCCEIATDAAELIHEFPELELLTTPTLSTVLFRFLPSLPGSPSSHTCMRETEVINKINDAIRRQLFNANELVIASTRRNGKTYLKFTILNPRLTKDDIRYALEKICAAGTDECAKLQSKEEIDD